MRRRVVGLHRDDAGDWVAELDCGHGRHVRHRPPWFERPWVLDPDARERAIGMTLECRKCDRGEPVDARSRTTNGHE